MSLQDIPQDLPASTPQRTRYSTPHPVFWVIAAALVAIAVQMGFHHDGAGLETRVLAQPSSSGASARGVFAFSGQLSKGTYGVYVVDTDAMTLWAYEYLSQKGCMRLAAARTWRYDRYLENYNACELPPEAVEKMVEEQRNYRLKADDSAKPTDSQKDSPH
ncbi:MAG: hypothetical protein HY287_03255 [Planctomycetes bacterium]|nr:hypothetical protein [Planctomycetota bacterium]MBI3833329.1 hypothetical protein [Planctomycetota bacterium]